MHRARVAGIQLDGADVSAFGDGDGDDEVSVNVLTLGIKCEWLGQRDDEIGFPQFPAFAPGRWQGCVAGRAFH
jgi:hypothetical protein